MLIDGEKWACEACVRGHRVSNCAHSDRPLQHINKKGRPVSQCQHCRSMRKSRAAHVKCDCGEKTSKCSHLQPSLEGHRGSCCCNHGGRCTCATKRDSEQLDTVPESDSERARAAASSAKCSSRRQRANTVHTDCGLTFDQNGHHKPAHRSNKTAQKSGPYPAGRPQLSQSSSHGSLPSPSSDDAPSFHSAPVGTSRTRDSTSSRGSSARGQRRVKSETASPMMSRSSSQGLAGHLPPLDLSRTGHVPFLAEGGFDLFGSSHVADTEGPIFSAGLTNPHLEWTSQYSLPDQNDVAVPSDYEVAGTPGLTGLLRLAVGLDTAPALAPTTSTSGDVSEVDDGFIAGDLDLDGFTAGTTSYLRSAHPLYSGPDFSSIGHDTFLKTPGGKTFTSNVAVNDGGPIGEDPLSLVDDDPAFWARDFLGGHNDTSEGYPSSTLYWDAP